MGAIFAVEGLNTSSRMSRLAKPYVFKIELISSDDVEPLFLYPRLLVPSQLRQTLVMVFTDGTHFRELLPSSSHAVPHG